MEIIGDVFHGVGADAAGVAVVPWFFLSKGKSPLFDVCCIFLYNWKRSGKKVIFFEF